MKISRKQDSKQTLIHLFYLGLLSKEDWGSYLLGWGRGYQTQATCGSEGGGNNNCDALYVILQYCISHNCSITGYLGYLYLGYPTGGLLLGSVRLPWGKGAYASATYWRSFGVGVAWGTFCKKLRLPEDHKKGATQIQILALYTSATCGCGVLKGERLQVYNWEVVVLGYLCGI